MKDAVKRVIEAQTHLYQVEWTAGLQAKSPSECKRVQRAEESFLAARLDYHRKILGGRNGET